MIITCFDISKLTDEEFIFLYNKSTSDRKAKTDRYRMKADKIRCIVAGALLEYALKKWLVDTPSSCNSYDKHLEYKLFDNSDDCNNYLSKLLEIKKNIHGKPFLKNFKDFRFNISHSGKWVIIGYGTEELGVDIEKINENGIESQKKLAERFFTQKEIEYISQNDIKFSQRFSEIWTGKEAYLKYKGTGICKSLDSVDVTEIKENGLFGTIFEEDYFLSFYSKKMIKNIETITFQTLCEN